MSKTDKNDISWEFTASPNTAKAAPRKAKAKRDADIRRQAYFYLPFSPPDDPTAVPLSDITPGEAFRFDDDGDICLMTDEQSFLILNGRGLLIDSGTYTADTPVIRVSIYASYEDLPSAAEGV